MVPKISNIKSQFKSKRKKKKEVVHHQHDPHPWSFSYYEYILIGVVIIADVFRP